MSQPVSASIRGRAMAQAAVPCGIPTLPERDIPFAVNELEVAIKRLDQHLSTLIGRLGPILRSDGMLCDREKEPTPIRVALANTLLAHTTAIRTLSEHVEEALASLEL